MHTAAPIATDVDDLTGVRPPSPQSPLQHHSISSMVPPIDQNPRVTIVSSLASVPLVLPTPPLPTSELQLLGRASPHLQARYQPSSLVGGPSRFRSEAPSQPCRTRLLQQLSTTMIKAANPMPKSSSKKKKKKQQDGQEATVELEYPKVPHIPPLPPVMAEHGHVKGLGCDVLEGSPYDPSGKRRYKLCYKLTEGKCPLYGIGFNFMDAKFYDIFATVGGNRVTTYRCLEDGSLALLQAYVDEDKDESFYTLSWARDDVDRSPLLVVGGSSGIIRVINCGTEKLSKSLVGHGGSINDIRTQALKPSLIISASKDESVRLWNIQTGICILIFSGAGGHLNQVLSADFHPSDMTCFASCGMDSTVKIWSMKEFWTYVEKSYSWSDHPSKFPTKCVQYPVLVAAVHSGYVDCTRWLGDFILSKSVQNEILLWEPKKNEKSPGEGSIDVLQKYPVPNCENWFIKFSCDFFFNQLAIGNSEGEIFVWEVHSSPPILTARLYNEQCKTLIRQTAVSIDGSTILGAGEDGTICRWDEVDHPSSKIKKKQGQKQRRGRQRRHRG